MNLCGYNIQIKKTISSLFVLLSNEKEGTFKFLFSYLKEKYNFNPRNIMCDYSLGQIKAIKEIFHDTQIIVVSSIFHMLFGMALKPIIYV